MKIISERITNISELEQIIAKSLALSKMLEKEMPNNETVKSLSKFLRFAAEFEFHIEHRTVHHCE